MKKKISIQIEQCSKRILKEFRKISDQGRLTDIRPRLAIIDRVALEENINPNILKKILLNKTN